MGTQHLSSLGTVLGPFLAPCSPGELLCEHGMGSTEWTCDRRLPTIFTLVTFLFVFFLFSFYYCRAVGIQVMLVSWLLLKYYLPLGVRASSVPLEDAGKTMQPNATGRTGVDGPGKARVSK